MTGTDPEHDDATPDRPAPEQRPLSRAEEQAAARARATQQQTWVDLQVRRAMDRGDFDDLPGAGRPIEGLGAEHDPDWWIKGLIERERVVVLPPSVELRKEDAGLDDHLDTLTTEGQVREHLEDFNSRVIAARYRLPEGPPLITMPRDVEAEIVAWHERRAVRRLDQRARLDRRDDQPARRRRWWRRR
ncbi:DUF1992 domain-containing protein [Nocardioides sp. dk4132]|uniref:DnaJ family domain-containing protein n=1 Tax=unclassified Nocardioides TaxID=2615069 RepID=UPI001295B6EB|nr:MULTISPECIES: DUF1992 domain-containing protein [unclassified Nocardioides]MQW77419.1 DUF1992 domain-containing protein [Nocardioides sp. dk4132]QGA09227.1 DUF1992 domain-containing protein [Nocardioides sp. dk884]